MVVIVSSVMFKNEFDILKYRMSVMGPFVDYFVIIESTKTFNGAPKPLYLTEQVEYRFSPDERSKMIIVSIDNFSSDPLDAWDNENKQRVAVVSAVNDMLMHVTNDSSIFVISDCDEIIRPSLLAELKPGGFEGTGLDPLTAYGVDVDTYYYNLRTLLIGHVCRAPIIITREALMRLHGLPFKEINKALRGSGDRPYVMHGGWHLSYFMSPEQASEKIKVSAHQELNHPLCTDINLIANRMTRGVDLFQRPDIPFKTIELKDNPNLPPLDGLEAFY